MNKNQTTPATVKHCRVQFSYSPNPCPHCGRWKQAKYGMYGAQAAAVAMRACYEVTRKHYNLCSIRREGL